MPQLSRRTFLQTAVALGLSVNSAPAMAGLLDRFLGQRTPKLTSPITSNEEFYVTSYQSPPTVRVNDWSLAVGGLVERTMTLTYTEFLARPAISQLVTLECVGNTVAGEFMSTAEWTGVPLRSLLDEARVSERAYDIVFHAADGYTDSLPYQRAIAGDVIIAHTMNGVTLPQGHGFPARVIVPGHYGMKSVQWLTMIEVVASHHKGYYQRKGWTEEAIVKTTSRIDLPEHGATIHRPEQKIQGLAFAGSRGIRQVEVSTDGGVRWVAAKLAEPLAAAAWRFWSYDWVVPSKGRHTLVVRAMDGTGALQSSVEQDPAPDGATGLHEITVTAEG